jgi:hypothetical protein
MVLAARAAGFSESTGKRLEGKHPDGGSYRLAARNAREMPDPMKTADLSSEAQRALEDFGYFQRRYLGMIALPWQVEEGEKIVELLESPDKEYAVMNGPPGCLTGDTKIKVNRAGNTKTFRLDELVFKFNGGTSGQGMKKWDPSIPTFAQGAAVSGNKSWGLHVRKAELTGAFCSGEKEVYELRTVNGRTIKATADHHFAIDGGAMVPLSDLSPGDCVLVNAGQGGRNEGAKQWYDSIEGLVRHPQRGAWPYRQPTHRLAVEADMNGLRLDWFVALLRDRDANLDNLQFLDPLQAVHHIDQNTHNNDLSNLAVKLHIDHWRDHGLDGGWVHVASHIQGDLVESITYVGTEPTFDLEVMDAPHNFVANEFVVHNSGKTQINSYALPLWLTARDRGLRGLIGSVTGRMAVTYTQRIRRALETVLPLEADSEDITKGIAMDALATLSEDFGRFKPVDHESWTKDAFIVEQLGGVSITNKEPTWTAVGRDQEFIGGRYDFCMWDDLVSLKRMRTIEMIEEDRDWWDSYAERRLEPGGLLILQGQRLNSEDLSRYCLNMEVGLDDEDDEDDEEIGSLGGSELRQEEGIRRKYHHIKFKAHYEELCLGKPTHKISAPAYPEGCLLAPRRLTWKELSSIQRNKPDTYAVVFQQEDVGASEVLVPKIWIDGNGAEFPGCWDKNRDRLEIPSGLSGETWSVMSCDPSPSRFWGIQWWCLAAGSKIATLRGEIPIESVRSDDKVLTRGGWRDVQHVTYMGDKAVLNIQLSNGRTLRCTPDHKILTTGGWYRADELTSASFVVAPHSGSSRTGSAGSFTSLTHDQVLSEVGMSARTMSFSHLDNDVGGAPHVGLVVLDGEVDGPYTQAVPAEMADFNLLRNFTDQRAICESVGKTLPVATQRPSDHPVGTASSCLLSTVPDSTVTDCIASVEEELDVDSDPLSQGVRSVVTGFTDNGLFTDNWVSASAGVHVVSITPGLFMPVYDIGVEGDLHEFTAEGVIVHNCFHPDSDQRFLIDLERRAMDADDFLDWNNNDQAFTGLLQEWWQTSVTLGFPITHVIVEVNAAQRFLLQFEHVRRWMMKTNVEIIPHSTHANKSNAEYGVQTLRPHYRFGRVRLPGKGEGRLCSMKLIEEVTRYPKGSTDDELMAQWFTEWQYPLIYQPSAANDTQAWRPSWMVA